MAEIGFPEFGEKNQYVRIYIEKNMKWSF